MKFSYEPLSGALPSVSLCANRNVAKGFVNDKHIIDIEDWNTLALKSVQSLHQNRYANTSFLPSLLSPVCPDAPSLTRLSFLIFFSFPFPRTKKKLRADDESEGILVSARKLKPETESEVRLSWFGSICGLGDEKSMAEV